MGRVVILILLITWQWSPLAEAQYSAYMGAGMGAGVMAGSGMWGAGQACGYGPGYAPGAVSEDPKVAKLRQQIKDVDDDISALQDKKESNDEKMEKYEGKLRDSKLGLRSGVVDFAIPHMREMKMCEDNVCQEDGEENRLETDGTTGGNQTPSDCRLWMNVCLSNGGVNSNLCKQVQYYDSKSAAFVSAWSKNCSNYLKGFQDAVRDNIGITQKIGELEAKREALEAKLEAAEDAAEERGPYTGGGTTEAECVECDAYAGGAPVVRQPKWWETLLGGVLTAGSIYAGYRLGSQGNKNVSTAIDKNAQLGFPSAPYQSFGYGFPFGLGGGYGAIGGMMGPGAFGCMPGIGGGGPIFGPMGMYGPGFGGMAYGGMGMPWGYPGAMFPGGAMGGGMFMPGMGPWGMAGPWGAGFPGMGGAMGGVMMGYPMMGGAMGAAMMGYPMMGGAMGTAMMGGAMGTAMMGGSLGGWEYQNMMMQQQMLYLEQQRRMSENNMEKMRLVNQLTQQLYQIQFQIQQVYMGGTMGTSTGGFSGGYIGGAIGSAIGFAPMGTSNTYTPVQSTGTEGRFVPPRGQ